MVEIKQQTENSINLFEKDNTSDALIYSFLASIKSESIGYRNVSLDHLNKRLEYYGKSDLNRMMKSVINLSKCDIDDEEKTQIYLQIATESLKRFHVITLEDSRQMMLFNSGCYSFDISRLDNFISNQIESFNVSHRYTYCEVIDYLKKQTLFQRDKLNYDPNVIVFKNGVFGIDVDKFYPHDKEESHAWHYFFEIPHNYKNDKKYKCPNFKRMLREWMSLPFSYVRVQDIFEAIGLCMTTNISYKAAFMNYGKAHTGKTQFFNIVKHVIGVKNMSALTLQRITKNEFGAIGLQFKLLNYCSDLGSRKIWDTSLFKNLTGGDELVYAEVKGGKPFGFRPTSKFWFNSNKVPPIEDIDDDAFFERFIMFMFANVFTRESSKTFRLDYYKEITTDSEEMQGIIHEAIKGLQRLIKRKGFRQEIRDNTKHIWNYESNAIYAYIYDYCTLDRNRFITADELYEDYMNNCRGVPETKNILTKQFQKFGIIKKKRTSEDENKKRPECYYGIQLKKNKKEDFETGKVDMDKILVGKTIIDDYNKVDFSDVERF